MAYAGLGCVSSLLVRSDPFGQASLDRCDERNKSLGLSFSSNAIVTPAALRCLLYTSRADLDCGLAICDTFQLQICHTVMLWLDISTIDFLKVLSDRYDLLFWR